MAIFAVVRARPVRLIGWWDRSKEFRKQTDCDSNQLLFCICLLMELGPPFVGLFRLAPGFVEVD
jgi:hypothetical protein